MPLGTTAARTPMPKDGYGRWARRPGMPEAGQPLRGQANAAWFDPASPGRLTRLAPGATLASYFKLGRRDHTRTIEAKLTGQVLTPTRR